MRDVSFGIADLRAGYLDGRFSPLDIVSAALERIAQYEKKDPAVWISRVPDDAVLARATELAKRNASTFPLYGIPFAVKDNIDCIGLPTTAGCPDYAYSPERNAVAVERLLQAGALLLGKTNLDQFATGLVGTRSPYGAPRCVFDQRYISGGSSSGSAVAVAAGLAAFALGTDTAGSGRVPAAYNNIVGLKPTRGVVSASGVVPACRSLDCVSILAGSVDDAHTVLEVARWFDEADPYARAPSVLSLPTEAFRFGVLAEEVREFLGNRDYAHLYEQAIVRLAACGGTPVEIDYTPFAAAAALLYDGAWTAERLAAIGPFMTGHEEVMNETVRAIISGARRLSAVDAFEGQYRLAEARRAAEREWQKMDLLFLPTVPTQYTVDAINADPIAANARLGRYTNFVNLLDYAAIALPVGFTEEGLAFGVTLIGPAFSDDALAGLGARFQSLAGSES